MTMNLTTEFIWQWQSYTKSKKDQIHRFILKRRVSLWAASNLCQILPPTLR